MKRLRNGRNSESGIALFMALFALLLLTSIALGLMFISTTETSVNYNYRGSVQAFYAAKAGTQEGVDRLRDGVAGYSIPRPTVMPSATSNAGVLYIVNKASASEEVLPWSTALSGGGNNQLFDDQLCNDRFTSGTTNLLGVAPTGSGIPCGLAVTGASATVCPYCTTTVSKDPNTGSALAMPYKWVRITLKQNATVGNNGTTAFKVDTTATDSSKVCWDGHHERALASLAGYTDCASPPAGGAPFTDVYLVTALARTTTGSRRMYQVEYAPAPPIQVSAAVASKAGVNLVGNLSVNGYDQCSCSCTTDNHGVVSCVPRVAGGTCDSSKYAIYSGGSVDTPNNSETVAAGTEPVIQANVASWPAGLDVQTLIDTYKPGATTVTDCASGCGTLPNPFPPTTPSSPTYPATPPPVTNQVTYVGGNADFNGGGGSGVLIIDGDARLHGGFQWYGLIIVKGTVDFTGGGSGTNIVGAVINGQDVTLNSDLDKLGGSVEISLDECAIKNAFKGKPLTYISSRELLY